METETVITKRKNKELAKQNGEKLALIDRIKQEIAQPFDNINNPIPLFKQLQSGK